MKSLNLSRNPSLLPFPMPLNGEGQATLSSPLRIHPSEKLITFLGFISKQQIVFSFSYQYGPDTYLMQVKDAGFPARLREYLTVAKQTSAEFQDVKVSFIYPIWIYFCQDIIILKIGAYHQRA